MSGPDILVDTLTHRGRTRAHQYDSRSNYHSNVAAWCAVLDLLHFAQHGPGGPHRLWLDVQAGRLGFRINQDLNASTNTKNIDIVLSEVSPDAKLKAHFLTVGQRLDVQIKKRRDVAYASSLATIPFFEVERGHLGNARIVIEAKAAMSDLTSAWPRLYAEILAAGVIARDAQVARSWRRSVVASLSLVNAATSFRSSTRGLPKKNKVGEAKRLVNWLASAFRSGMVTTAFRGAPVFDALGITVIECENDASVAVSIHAGSSRHPNPAPVPGHASYDQMIADICNKY